MEPCPAQVREICDIALFRIRLAAWDRIAEGG